MDPQRSELCPRSSWPARSHGAMEPPALGTESQPPHLPAADRQSPAVRTHAERGGTTVPPLAPASGWSRRAGKGRGPRLPAAARKMGQSGKVQGVGKGTRSRALSLPRSKENKVMVSLPSDKGIPRDQREGGRSTEEDQSGGGGEARERPAQKTGKKDLTPTKARAQTACTPPKTGHREV